MGDGESCQRFVARANRSQFAHYRFLSQPQGLPSGEQFHINHSPLVDEVFIVGDGFNLSSAAHPVTAFLRAGKAVHLVAEVPDGSLYRHSLGSIAGIPVLSISAGRLTKLGGWAKRVFDLLGASLLLALSLPVFVIIAVLIKVTSFGPILFKQRRLGRRGSQFSVFKFRTMRCGAEDELLRCPDMYKQYVANNYKLPPGEDPRVTRIGRFLRATSLDELPQLINVIKGEMSLVGPRPVVPAEISEYGAYAGLFLSVKPGMTGRWQISGRSGIREYKRRVELDLEYVRDQSLLTDCRILLRTVPTVLWRKGAH